MRIVRGGGNKPSFAVFASLRLATAGNFASGEIGGEEGNRNPDTRIFSPLLYQLSYLAACVTQEWFLISESGWYVKLAGKKNDCAALHQ